MKQPRTDEGDPHAEGADDAVLLGPPPPLVQRRLAIRRRAAAVIIGEEGPPRALGRLEDGGGAALPIDGEACEGFTEGQRNRAEEDESVE